MFKKIYIFCLVVAFQGCITPKAKYSSKSRLNNNPALFTINGAQLENKKSLIGITTQVASIGLGGFLGYKYFPVALGYKNNTLNASAIGGAALGSVVGYGLNNSFNYLLGERKTFAVNQNNYPTWKRSFDPSRDYVALNHNYSGLEFIDKKYERNFTVNNLQDAIYFKTGFPQSQYSKQVFDRALTVADRESLQSLSKLFPEENQEVLKQKHLLSSKTFSEYKQSVEYFPSNKALGETYLAKTAKSYSDLRAFDILFPNSVLTQDITTKIISALSISELTTLLKNYKKHLVLTDLEKYGNPSNREELYEWLLAFNDDQGALPLKIKYLNPINNLAGFVNKAKSLHLTLFNNEYDTFLANKNLTNGESVFNKISTVTIDFDPYLTSQLKAEVLKLTIENLTTNYKSKTYSQIKSIISQLESSIWLSKHAANEVASKIYTLDFQKTLAQISEFKKAFLEAINNKNETLVRNYLNEGAETKDLSYEQFYFISQLNPTTENAEILYQKLTQFDQYSSFLKLFPSYTEEFERKVKVWGNKNCELYVSHTTQTQFSRTGSFLWSSGGIASKNDAVVYDLVIPSEKLDEYKTISLIINKINVTETRNIFDLSGAINGYDYWVISDENNSESIFRRESADNYKLRTEKDFDDFINEILINGKLKYRSGCKNDIVFKEKLHDKLSPTQKQARINEAEKRTKRNEEYLERENKRASEKIIATEKREQEYQKKEEENNEKRIKKCVLDVNESLSKINGKEEGIFNDCPCLYFEDPSFLGYRLTLRSNSKDQWFWESHGLIDFSSEHGPFVSKGDAIRAVCKEMNK
jgi:hypothetical protein